MAMTQRRVDFLAWASNMKTHGSYQETTAVGHLY